MQIKVKPALESEISESEPLCLSRRHFLLTGTTAIVMSTMPGIASAVQLASKDNEIVRVASLNDLKTDQPIDFSSPPNNASISMQRV